MSLLNKLANNEESAPNTLDLSPLLDVVFILLIFFIVTTVFVKEAGVEVDKPQAVTAQQLEQQSILFAVTPQGEVYHNSRRIGVEGVRAVVSQELQKSTQPVILQLDKRVPAELIVNVIDQAKLGGATTVSLATELK